jgi:hypothetical protein
MSDSWIGEARDRMKKKGTVGKFGPLLPPAPPFARV